MNKDPMSELDPTASIAEQAFTGASFSMTEALRAPTKKPFGEWVSRSPERIEAYIQAARLTKSAQVEEIALARHTDRDPGPRSKRNARRCRVSFFVQDVASQATGAAKSSSALLIFAMAATLTRYDRLCVGLSNRPATICDSDRRTAQRCPQRWFCRNPEHVLHHTGQTHKTRQDHSTPVW